MSDRTTALIEFLALADRLKHIERRGETANPNGTARRENSAEPARLPRSSRR